MCSVATVSRQAASQQWLVKNSIIAFDDFIASFCFVSVFFGLTRFLSVCFDFHFCFLGIIFWLLLFGCLHFLFFVCYFLERKKTIKLGE